MESVSEKNLPSLNRVVHNFMHFVSTNSRRPRTVSTTTATTYSRPDYYQNYNRNINKRLKEINNNLSNALTESVSEIDSICNKVRMCLKDMDYYEEREKIRKPEAIPAFSDNECSVIEELSPVEEVETPPIRSNEKEPIDVKVLPDFTTFINDKKTTLKKQESSHRRNKKIINEFRNMVFSQKYDNKCIDNIIDSIHKKIENLSVTTVNKSKTAKIIPKKSAHNIETQVSKMALNKPKSLENLPPDVYRKTGTIDLFNKLRHQIEANDSYICFQKLMVKNLINTAKGSKNPTTQMTVKQLKKKYKDSLWFSQKNSRHTKALLKKLRGQSEVSLKTKSDKSKSDYTLNEKRRRQGASVEQNKSCIDNSSSGRYPVKVQNERPSSGSERWRNNWLRLKHQQAPPRQLQYLDILDNLTVKDLMPLKSEYPRKDKKTADCKDYLHLLTEEGLESTWVELLKTDLNSAQGTTVDLDLNQADDQNDQMDHNETPPENHPQAQNMSKHDVIHKLHPYIFNEEFMRKQELTVLPVQVIYENKPKLVMVKEMSKPAFNQKCSIITMKEEPRGPERAKWSTPSPTGSAKRTDSKPHVVRKEHRWSPLEFKESASITKRLTVQSSRSPKSDKFQVKPKRSCVNTKKTVVVDYMGASPPFFPQGPVTSKKVDPKMETEIQKQVKHVTPSDKKHWAYKYTKGVGNQLINFIENQKELSYTKLPKYTQPKEVISGEANFSRLTRKKSMHHKRMLSHLKNLKEKNYTIQNNIERAINVIEAKLADILSRPESRESKEAFDYMEQEITNVLSMIKCTDLETKSFREQATKGAKSTDAAIDEFDAISKELFMKLERILESDNSRSTTARSTNSSRSRPVSRTTSTSKQRARSLPPEDHDDVPTKESGNKNLPTTIQAYVMINEDVKLEEMHGDELVYKISESSVIADEVDNSQGDFSRECAIKEKGKKSKKKGAVSPVRVQSPKNSEATPLVEQAQETVNAAEAPVKEIVMQNQQIETEIETMTKVKSNKLSCIEEEAETSMSENKKDESTVDQVTSQPFSEILPKEPQKFVEVTSDNYTTNYPEHINKIIRRVEDIYKELDELPPDLEFEDGGDIPVFREESQVIDVSSEEFLTPFMQAVKEKRKNSSSSLLSTSLTRSPSYYNILNFLESLNDIQQQDVERVEEAYVATLWSFPLVFQEARVLRSLNIEHSLTVIPEKPSCLKRTANKAQGKKVTFLMEKEHKESQVDLCETSLSQDDEHKRQEHTTQCSTVTSSDSQAPNRSSSEYKEIAQQDTQEDTLQDSISNVVDDASCFFDEASAIDKGGGNISNDGCCQSDSNDQSQPANQYFLETDPEINVIYDEMNVTIPRVIIKHKVCESNKDDKTEKPNKNPNIVVFREISEVSDYLQPLRNLENLPKEFRNIQIIKKFRKIHGKDLCSRSDENTTFLKSIYAFVYIMMFTALNLEYVCL